MGDPVWGSDETKSVPLLTEKALMQVVVFDWDETGDDDFLGECLIDLKHYADGKSHRLALHLDQYQSGPTNDAGDRVKGYIIVEVQVTAENRASGVGAGRYGTTGTSFTAGRRNL